MLHPAPSGPSRRIVSSVPLVREGEARARSYAVLHQVEHDCTAEAEASRLVWRARQGDELAVAELYVQFYDRVYRYLVVALKNPDDAQEVAQDVFVHALSKLARYEPERGSFGDWLFSMVRSRAIDHLRKRRVDAVEPATPSHPAGAAERAATLLDRLDPGSGARDLIETLPDAQRRVVALRFVFQLSTTEIADVLGLTPAHVRQLQHRALKALAVAVVRDAA